MSWPPAAGIPLKETHFDFLVGGLRGGLTRFGCCPYQNFAKIPAKIHTFIILFHSLTMPCHAQVCQIAESYLAW